MCVCVWRFFLSVSPAAASYRSEKDAIKQYVSSAMGKQTDLFAAVKWFESIAH